MLGGGFAVVPVGGKRLVQSVPGELSMDHTAVLQKAEVSPASCHTHFGTWHASPTPAHSSHECRHSGEGAWLDRAQEPDHPGACWRQRLGACVKASLSCPSPSQEHLVCKGMAWVDDQEEGGDRLYWFPGLFTA